MSMEGNTQCMLYLHIHIWSIKNSCFKIHIKMLLRYSFEDIFFKNIFCFKDTIILQIILICFCAIGPTIVATLQHRIVRFLKKNLINFEFLNLFWSENIVNFYNRHTVISNFIKPPMCTSFCWKLFNGTKKASIGLMERFQI